MPSNLEILHLIVDKVKIMPIYFRHFFVATLKMRQEEKPRNQVANFCANNLFDLQRTLNATLNYQTLEYGTGIDLASGVFTAPQTGEYSQWPKNLLLVALQHASFLRSTGSIHVFALFRIQAFPNIRFENCASKKRGKLPCNTKQVLRPLWAAPPLSCQGCFILWFQPMGLK